MKDLFVWRESVYKNNFKCNVCGAKLFNSKTGRPTDNLAVDAEDAENPNPTEPIYCYCGRCKNPVATWQPVDADVVDNDNILQGSYSEWIEKKAVDRKADIEQDVEKRLSKKYEQKIKLLEDTIASRDAQIKRIKEDDRRRLLEQDKEIQKLQKELYHVDLWMQKMTNMLSDMDADAEGKVREFQSAINEELGILGN